MKLRVLAIEVPPEATEPLARFTVRVQLEANGNREWFDFKVSPLGMPGSSVHVIQASLDLVDRYRDMPQAVQHLRTLVGQAVSKGTVHLPQMIAA